MPSDLLRQMDEFSQSRFRLESRYHHVLVDEFQDTSRRQWDLVALLVQSWGEGFGLVHDAPLPPSLFIVGDRKQSIYRFRDANVALLDEAAATIRGLRPGGGVRRYISRSFRALPPLLAFVNDVCREVAQPSDRRRRLHLRRAGPVPDRRVARAPVGLGHPRHAARAPCRGRCRRVRRAVGRRDRAAARRRGPCATARPACRARSRPATSPSCSGRASRIASSSARSRRGASPATSTRGSASTIPTRSRTASRSFGSSPPRSPSCAPRRSCARASSGMSDRRDQDAGRWPGDAR